MTFSLITLVACVILLYLSFTTKDHKNKIYVAFGWTLFSVAHIAEGASSNNYDWIFYVHCFLAPLWTLIAGMNFLLFKHSEREKENQEEAYAYGVVKYLEKNIVK